MKKKCLKCGVKKSSFEFHKHKRQKDGLYYYCKDCEKIIGKIYYEKTKTERIKYQKEYIKLNPGKIKKWKDRWRKKNRKRLKKERKLYYIKNKKQILKKRRKQHLLSKYNISIKDYNKLLKKQNNKCYICSKKEKQKLNGKIKRLHIDHNHKTSKIRGLLCNNCNLGLGNFQENILFLKKAIKYLRKEK